MTEGAQQVRLVVFDVCDTLYDANTTLDFIDYYHRQHSVSCIGRVIRRWRSRRSPYFYLGALAHRLLGFDIARRRIIRSLAGQPKAALHDAAREFVRDVLPQLANQELHDLLASHRRSGDRVLLMSSSLDLVIAPIAAQLGVDHRASALGFSGDRSTGQITDDLTGRKASAIADLRQDTAELWVYTDNRSDADIVSIADRAIIVIPNGKADSRWGGNDCDYIRL